MAILDDHRDAARADLRLLVQPDTEPKLTGTELEALLNKHRRATFWVTAVAYAYGDVVQPNTKNGHRYVCIEGGTSAATEPTWPTGGSAVVNDGDTLRWREDGPAWANVYDVRAAAHEAFFIKEVKAGELFDRGGQQYSQVTDHCRRMKQSMAPIKFA